MEDLEDRPRASNRTPYGLMTYYVSAAEVKGVVGIEISQLHQVSIARAGIVVLVESKYRVSIWFRDGISYCIGRMSRNPTDKDKAVEQCESIVRVLTSMSFAWSFYQGTELSSLHLLTAVPQQSLVKLLSLLSFLSFCSSFFIPLLSLSPFFYTYHHKEKHIPPSSQISKATSFPFFEFCSRILLILL